LLGLFFDSEDWGDILVRKVGLTFCELHGVISQKIELYKTLTVFLLFIHVWCTAFTWAPLVAQHTSSL
jgi:hypothetical protein